MNRREEILVAAQNAFQKFGIEKITLEDIAKECGIQKTALYYYFKNKDEILAEMILLKIREYQTNIVEALTAAEGVKEKLRTYMTMKINMMHKDISFMRLFEKERLPNKAKNFLEKHKKDILETDFYLVKSVIEQGIKNKKVSFKLNDSLVLMILGVTYGTFIGRFLENENWDIEEMINTSIEVIFNGIR